jgi:transcriptional regulator with XRE-family HTH domain
VSIVGKRLRQARERAGISQKQLGEKAGIDPGVASARINQYEKGKHLPHLATAKQLAKVLGVPTPYFYADDDALADWILAYTRVSTATRKSIVNDAG